MEKNAPVGSKFFSFRVDTVQMAVYLKGMAIPPRKIIFTWKYLPHVSIGGGATF